MQRRALALFAIALLAGLTTAQSSVCVGQEIPPPANSEPVGQLPPPATAQPNGPAFPKECEPVPADKPLSAITTDIRPRTTTDGKLVAADQLPFNCAGVKPVQTQMMSIDLSCDSCYPRYCDLLSMAGFWHKPLYFNDDCLERCGVKHCCCQPCASAMCFYGRALLLPVTACCVCPCSYVPSGGCCQ